MGCGHSGPAPPPVGSSVIVEHEGAVEPGHATSAGVIRFVGAVPSLKSGIWIGVELDEPVGNCSGRVDGQRIFKCRPRHGVLARPACVLLESDFWGSSSESNESEVRSGAGAAPRDSFFGRLRTAVLGTSVSVGEPSGRLAADCEAVLDMAQAEKERGAQRFLSLQTRALERKFPQGNFDLQCLDRMFSHIKKMLREYETRHFDDVFPEEWGMKLSLAKSCSSFARRAIVRLLEEQMDRGTEGSAHSQPATDGSGSSPAVAGEGLVATGGRSVHSSSQRLDSSLSLDISVLVRGVSQASAFEQFLDSCFNSGGGGDDDDDAAVSSEAKSKSKARNKEKKTKEEKKKKKIKTKTKKKKKKHDQAGHEASSADAEPHRFGGCVADAFEPYLVVVVRHQSDHLEQVVQELLVEEMGQRSAHDGERAEPGFKFKSAINMFMIMRDNLEQCAAISRGQALMLLQGSLKSILHKYADTVAAQLPIKVPKAGLARAEVVTTCATLNTAGYCDRTVAQLRALVVRLLNDGYGEHVDMLAEQEYFHDVLIPGAMSLLLDHTMTSCKKAFRMLKSKNWMLVKDVGEPSKCVTILHDTVKDTVQQIRNILDDVMYSAFCDRLVGLLLPAFLHAIFQCQRIGHAGSLQLLLDSSIVQKLVLTLPSLPAPSHGGVSAAVATQPAPETAYAQLVALQMSHVHAALQMVGMDVAYIEKSFLELWPDGFAEDLMDVLKLKGLLQEDRREYATRLGLPYRNDPSSAWDAPLTPGVAPLKVLSEGLNQAWQSTRKTLTMLDSPLVGRSGSDPSPPLLQRSASGPARARQELPAAKADGAEASNDTAHPPRKSPSTAPRLPLASSTNDRNGHALPQDEQKSQLEQGERDSHGIGHPEDPAAAEILSRNAAFSRVGRPVRRRTVQF